ncbi:uncharacterized protein RHOBADRAFT_49653 [Rhodotorula graminis WP1]|uniref:Uncharacterized protein n=1 Tax=Rhodotorula graminis (strain WP1) TaxID=578459 RepID=A0A194S3H1_RHOGW|nr:uncharacterized protein RHOBADRAFT_49653 [Rhodotorula graminis WP1]KPV75283.1 hypothetical protein RHOBADRAFT_49653 [Rhodotorula graminis WP1]
MASSTFLPGGGGGGSRTRLSSCAGTSSALSSHEASPRSRSRSARRRTRTRSTSTSASASGTRSGSTASSTASTDGSTHEDHDRAGEVSSEDDHLGHASGLVMPSLHLDAASATPPRRSSPARARAYERDAPVPPSARLLVLGKSAANRRTLARLVARDGERDDDDDDDDLRRTTSAASVAGATDMSYSYLSFGPPSSSSHDRCASRARAAAAAMAAAAERPTGAFFEPLVCADEPVALWHPARDDGDAHAAAELVDELSRPLERLEAKLSRSYPATTGLAQVVEAAGCGEFEACLFLFSSPPLASEIALARPVSHVLPVLPVLVLPPSPTGKPQKTAALSQAVQEQLNTAGVRWAPALVLPRSPAAAAGGGASPLYMLPHDLFVQHDGDDVEEQRRVPHHVPSVTSMPASSPESEDAPPSSLSSSQEFVTHLDHRAETSSYYTSAGSSIAGDHREREFGRPSSSATAARGAARSLSASSRAGSTSSRSSSPRRHGHGHGQALTRSATHRPRTLSLSSSASSSAGAPPSAFLEWREVEVAARASSGSSAREDSVVELPEVWGERVLDDVEEGGGTGRRMLDFSRRVAERRRVLGRRAACGTRGAVHEDGDDGDVLAASDDEGEHVGERDTGAASFATEPMTPRCAHRPLLSPITTRSAPVPTDSYFPAVAASTSSTSPVDPLALSTHSLAPSTTNSTSSGAPSSALAASSVLVLPSADPFHLPSLLHLVGLNLRLAVFAPSFASASASSTGSATSLSASSSPSAASSPRRSARSEKREAAWAIEKENGGATQGAPRPWAWWRTAGVVGLVFAAGVAVGTVVASASASAACEAHAVGPAVWSSRGRL